MLRYLVFSILCIQTSLAQSAAMWSWSIDTPVRFVNSGEAITVSATLRNDPNSLIPLENLDGSLASGLPNLGLLVTFRAPLLVHYEIDYGLVGDGDFQSQFGSVIVEPGETYDFILYTLFPKNDMEPPPGEYEITDSTLWIASPEIESQNSGAVRFTVVPLPAAFGMLAPALLSLLCKRRAA